MCSAKGEQCHLNVTKFLAYDNQSNSVLICLFQSYRLPTWSIICRKFNSANLTLGTPYRLIKLECLQETTGQPESLTKYIAQCCIEYSSTCAEIELVALFVENKTTVKEAPCKNCILDWLYSYIFIQCTSM